MQPTHVLLLFVALSNFQGAFACQAKTSTESKPIPIAAASVSQTTSTPPIPTSCPTWGQAGREKMFENFRISDIEASAFHFVQKNQKIFFSEAVEAMKSLMNETNTGEIRGNATATILSFLETNPQLKGQMASIENLVRAALNENATMTQRLKHAELALNSSDAMLREVEKSVDDRVLSEGESGPYVLSLAAIYVAIGRFIVMYERANSCNDKTSGDDPNQLANKTITTILPCEDLIRHIETKFSDLENLLKECVKEGGKRRIEMIEPKNLADCMHTYSSQSYDQSSKSCNQTFFWNINPDEVTFLSGCVKPNANESEAVKKITPPARAFRDHGTGEYICEQMSNCGGGYKYYLQEAYAKPFTLVLSRLYLGTPVQNRSTSWNELLGAEIFPAEWNVMKTPPYNRNGLLEELDATLNNGAAMEKIHSSYRELFNRPTPVDAYEAHERKEQFVQSLRANAQTNLDYEAGLSPWNAIVNRFTDTMEPATSTH